MRALLCATLLVSTAARAQQAPVTVYLNDVKVDSGSVKNVTLNSVDVSFDERGDVHIVARGYKVTSESQAPEAPFGGRHYYVVPSTQRRVGAAQWEVDVYINQTFVHKFRSKIPEPYVEVTRFLKPGTNTVHFSARKESGERVSTSPVDAFELGIGSGNLMPGGLSFNAITNYRRTAAETGAFQTDVSFEVTAPGR